MHVERCPELALILRVLGRKTPIGAPTGASAVPSAAASDLLLLPVPLLLLLLLLLLPLLLLPGEGRPAPRPPPRPRALPPPPDGEEEDWGRARPTGAGMWCCMYPLFFRREGRQAMSVVFTYDISSRSWVRWVEKGMPFHVPLF